jgi:hypothetical protein
MGDPTDVIPKVRQFVREAARDSSTFGFTRHVVAAPADQPHGSTRGGGSKHLV